MHAVLVGLERSLSELAAHQKKFSMLTMMLESQLQSLLLMPDHYAILCVMSVWVTDLYLIDHFLCFILYL
jgi:hypothetical protein